MVCKQQATAAWAPRPALTETPTPSLANPALGGPASCPVVNSAERTSSHCQLPASTHVNPHGSSPQGSCGCTQGLLGPVPPLLKPTWRSCMAPSGGSSRPAADLGPAAGPAVFTCNLVPCHMAWASVVRERQCDPQSCPPHG